MEKGVLYSLAKLLPSLSVCAVRFQKVLAFYLISNVLHPREYHLSKRYHSQYNHAQFISNHHQVSVFAVLARQVTFEARAKALSRTSGGQVGSN